jgi:hypothetical protein
MYLVWSLPTGIYLIVKPVLTLSLDFGADAPNIFEENLRRQVRPNPLRFFFFKSSQHTFDCETRMVQAALSSRGVLSLSLGMC